MMNRALSVMTGAVAALWLVAASFMVVLSPPVTSLLADRTVNSEGSIHTHEYLVSIAEATRAFSVGDDNAPLPQGTDDRIAFPPDVISHLLDVRAVFVGAIVFFWVATALLVLVLVLNLRPFRLPRTSQRCCRVSPGLGAACIAGGLAPLALCIIFALVGILAFDALFEWMHTIFFDDGTWQFSYDSLLIRALPGDFWMGCAAVWAISLTVLCLASILIGVLLRRRQGRSTPK